MKIIIDLQGLQIEGNRKRGIGRYCLDMTKALIHDYPENEYILFTNSALPDLRNDFNDELNNPRFKLIYFECPTIRDVNESYMGIYSSFWSSIQLRSYALSIINADIILITSFFDGFRDDSLISYDDSFHLPPIVSIIYDLIPLIYSEQYLNDDPEYNLFYLNKIKELANLDGLLAISHSSMKEAAKYLEINPENIYNISSACNTRKFSRSCFDSSFDTQYLGRFLLYCGAIDPRKNLSRLIEAYAKLPLNLICKHKLVLTGPITHEEILLIKEWMITFGLPPEYVIFLGFVKDIELANLYSTCHLFIFPSMHEGFGLPVLEAMNCGAPVIASNVTSMPEIIGDKKFLFNPLNVKEISSMIYKSLIDDKFYQSICSNSRKRVNDFSWQNTSKRTIESLQKIIYKKSNLLKKKEVEFSLLIKTQYNKLINSFADSPVLRSSNKSKSPYLQSLAAAISIINGQSNKIELIRQIRNNKKLSWHIEGPFDTSYSLAILNKNYALAMDKLGQNVALFSTDGLGDYSPNPAFLKNNKIVSNLYKRAMKTQESFFICSRNLYPPRVKDVKGVINLLHAYGWEESEFPKQWVDDFNTNLEGISAMSYQVKKTLIDNGVNLPITVTGLGLDHFSNIQSTNYPIIDAKKFKILHISSCFPRKGIDILIQAFANSFTTFDDVSLIIKTFDNPHNEIDSLLENFRKSYSNFPHVIVIKDELNDSQIKSLYEQSDLLVAPSRGEGFGLPIAEAMLLGIPVITTNWGGQVDFANPKTSWLIDYEFVSSTSHFDLDLSYWAEPSVEHLSLLLKQIYNLSKIEILQKVEKAKEEIRLYTWRNVAKHNYDFVGKKLCSFKPIKIKIGWVSTWHSNCGIASYSRRLINYMNDNLVVFSPFHESYYQKSELNVVPSWNFISEGNQNLEFLFSKIVSEKITSLVIQFNYGFFEFDELSEFIKKCYKGNINVMLFLHSTLDPLNQNNKCLHSLLDSLKMCKRLFVHTISDLNRLKKIGLVNNVSLFPHGIIDAEINNPKSNTFLPNIKKTRNFSIASYGFCLPNKGFLELVESINILRNYGIQLKLDIYSSIYNNDYYWVYQKIINLISDLDLGHLVNIHPEYIEESKIADILSNHDLIVFPYQSSNESSSAAVRDALASLRPVLVTPLPIFDDVNSFVDYFPGFSSEQLAKGLRYWHASQLKDPLNLSTFSRLRINQLKHRRFSSLSQRISNIIQSIELNNS